MTVSVRGASARCARSTCRSSRPPSRRPRRHDHVLLQQAARRLRVREPAPARRDPAQRVGLQGLHDRRLRRRPRHGRLAATTASTSSLARPGYGPAGHRRGAARRPDPAGDDRRARPSDPAHAVRLRLLRPRRLPRRRRARSTRRRTRATAAAIEENAITLLRTRGDAAAAERQSQADRRDRHRTRRSSSPAAARATSRRSSRADRARGDPRARPGVTAKVSTTTAPTPTAAAALAKSADVALVFAGDYQTEGTDRRCLTLECPRPGRPGRADREGRRRAAEDRRRARDRRPRADAVARQVARARRGLVPRPAGRPGARAGAVRRRRSGRPPARDLPASEADTPTAGDPELPGRRRDRPTTPRACSSATAGTTRSTSRRRTRSAPACSYTRSAKGRCSSRRAPGRGATVRSTCATPGRRRGVAVPQLYLGLPQPEPGVTQPPRALKGYAKLALGRGRHRAVRMRLDERAFSYWDTAAERWAVAPGCYQVWVGRSSRELVRHGALRVASAGGKQRVRVSPGCAKRG